jgi:hypothetical protein
VAPVIRCIHASTGSPYPRTGVSAQAAQVVPPARPGSPLAPNPRSIPHRGVRIHAAADPGFPSPRVLPAVSPALSQHRVPGLGSADSGEGKLGRPGILPESRQPPPPGSAGSRAPGWQYSFGSGGAPTPARRGPVYRRRHRELCLRAVDPGGGYQRGEGAAARVSPPAQWASRNPEAVEHGCAGTSPAGENGLELQSGHDRAGSAGLYRERSAVWDLSGPFGVCDGKIETCPGRQPSIAPANSATRPKTPAIEATMR